jgi:hypothetical protein
LGLVAVTRRLQPDDIASLVRLARLDFCLDSNHASGRSGTVEPLRLLTISLDPRGAGAAEQHIVRFLECSFN